MWLEMLYNFFVL